MSENDLNPGQIEYLKQLTIEMMPGSEIGHVIAWSAAHLKELVDTEPDPKKINLLITDNNHGNIVFVYDTDKKIIKFGSRTATEISFSNLLQ